MYLKCVSARRTAGRRRGAAVENEPGMGQIDDEQSRRHPQAPLAPHGPSRAPPCQLTPSLHLTLARALTAQLTAVRLVPQVRSEAQGDPPSSSRSAQSGHRAQLASFPPSSPPLAAGSDPVPGAALHRCARMRPVLACAWHGAVAFVCFKLDRYVPCRPCAMRTEPVRWPLRSSPLH